MTDTVTATTDSIVPDALAARLLATADCDSGVRGLAHATLTEEASYGYGLAHGLSGGGDLHPDAHSVGIANLLGRAVPAAVAFALHHLDELLPDFTVEQWERINAASRALHPRIHRDLTGANGAGSDPLLLPPSLHEGT